MNNPKNNPYASGFCNCALPAMEQLRDGWFIADRTQIEKRFTTSNFTTISNRGTGFTTSNFTTISNRGTDGKD